MVCQKIIATGIIIAALTVAGFAFSGSAPEQNSEESEMPVKGDVIMPAKASRPGCEELDRCYIPSTVTVESGKQVIWVNEDSAFHSVTSGLYDEPTDLFDSGHLDPSESFAFEFKESGTYDYFCTLHPWMEGQVMVG